MRLARLLPLVLAVPLFLPACGGGSGSSPAPNLSGWWLHEDDRGSGYEPVRVVQLDDTGAAVWTEGLAYARNDNVLRAGDPDRVSPDRMEYDLTVLNESLLEGARSIYNDGAYDGAIGERLTRVAVPDGTLTINGVIDGTPIARSSMTAHAEEHAAASRHTIYLVDSRPDGRSRVDIYFAVPAPLVAGVWPVSDAATTTRITISTDREYESSLSGSITFTSFAGGRIVGDYSIALVGGGTVTGSFDVPVLLTTGP